MFFTDPALHHKLGLYLIISLILISSIGNVEAQMMGRGACPTTVSAVPEFNATKFEGTWYEHSKSPVNAEASRSCSSDTYTVYGDGTIDVLNNYTVTLTKRNVSSISQTLHQRSPPSGKLSATFTGFTSYILPSETPFWILGVDYDNWVVVYSCNRALARLMNMRYVWILTRTRDPDTSTIKAALAVLDENGISPSSLRRTDQLNCD